MILEKFNLEGKTALITGACGLLGNEHAIALLELGATIVLTDIDEKILKVSKDNFKTLGYDDVVIKVMDVSSHENVEKVNEELKNAGVEVDVLINNAAIDPKVKKNESFKDESRLENFQLNDWDLQLNVGLKGAFICSKIFGYEMAKRNSGVILNIASDLSVFSPDQRLYEKDDKKREEQPVKPVTYSVIKHGLVGLTKYLSTYWNEEGVRSNALSPGGVYNGQNENFVLKLEKLIPVGRMAKKDEYRSAIQFLCSDASAYLNGQNIVMDGGRSVW